MIRIQAVGLYSSDFGSGETRLGDATIIDDGKNFEVIAGGCGKCTDRLISALKARGIKTPYLHISHPHYDHRYGIRKIINDSYFKPKALYCQDPGSIKPYNNDVKSDIEALKVIIREAKAKGIPVTCDTGPHYLVLCDEELQEEGRFKMNPPIRSAEDRDALIAGIIDGTVDMIATDHAPHSEAEKARGLEKSAFGIVGLETAFPILYTYLVKKGIITLEKLIEIMSVNPCKRFGLPGGIIEDGAPADLTVLDLNTNWTINSADFVSLGKATPLDGCDVCGEVFMTIVNGEVVYEKTNA